MLFSKKRLACSEEAIREKWLKYRSHKARSVAVVVGRGRSVWGLHIPTLSLSITFWPWECRFAVVFIEIWLHQWISLRNAFLPWFRRGRCWCRLIDRLHHPMISNCHKVTPLGSPRANLCRLHTVRAPNTVHMHLCNSATAWFFLRTIFRKFVIFLDLLVVLNSVDHKNQLPDRRCIKKTATVFTKHFKRPLLSFIASYRTWSLTFPDKILIFIDFWRDSIQPRFPGIRQSRFIQEVSRKTTPTFRTPHNIVCYYSSLFCPASTSQSVATHCLMCSAVVVLQTIHSLSLINLIMVVAPNELITIHPSPLCWRYTANRL